MEPKHLPHLTEDELMAPVRGIVISLALCIPFWVVVGVIVGILVSR